MGSDTAIGHTRMNEKPNIVLIMTDQQRADLAAREGFPLDTTPFLDGLARRGVWFNRAYTTNPTCAPARVSLLTGRYPEAHRVRTNHNIPDAAYTRDLIDVVRSQGYAAALSGKNHSHLTDDRLDFARHFSHRGGEGDDRSDDEKAFDQYLADLNHKVNTEPTPFPVEVQGPYRAVSAAQEFVRSVKGNPFFLWLSFAEPHNPYQAPEPYYSMFPPETLPPTRAGKEALDRHGFKWTWTHTIGQTAYPDYDAVVPRGRANYLGMLRLIDDQVKRFVGFLEAEGRLENTLIIFVSDHGDFVGEYGLMRKGPEMPELLMRIPLLVVGPGVAPHDGPHPAFVSIADLMPTLCDMLGVPLPEGVQGRSLWPMLRSESYPEAEFASAYGEHGFGGLHFTAEDEPSYDECVIQGKHPSFDCLNSVSQSGTMRMLRMGDWKLAFDMQGRGQLYNIAKDPTELDNVYGQPHVLGIERDMLAELLAWSLRMQDPLPAPRRRYKTKRDRRNYWSPYR
ncbi:sulfatase-like hydrolase/transferase [bacterium]|nr:sulfatase-like hydrolase/transferase [bacterium]